ncbi:MAG: hypothetical protein IPK99_14080, partial [Flavobacteriales bacterium]|nr:hypothetical protein [Flavobacteriales bacterium]
TARTRLGRKPLERSGSKVKAIATTATPASTKPGVRCGKGMVQGERNEQIETEASHGPGSDQGTWVR